MMVPTVVPTAVLIIDSMVDLTAVLMAVLTAIRWQSYGKMSTKHQQNYILVRVELQSGLRRGTDAEFFYCIFKHVELEFCMYATTCSDEWGC